MEVLNGHRLEVTAVDLNIERKTRSQITLPGHVPHIQQCYNWDCGLACALMVLRAFGLRHFDMANIRALCPTSSVWSIDLGQVLKLCGLDVTFLTTTIGANAAYQEEQFYADSILEDSARVEQLFTVAPVLGISIFHQSTSLEQFRQLASLQTALLVVLVDKGKLGNHEKSSFDGRDKNMKAPRPPFFVGHYIVVFGYEKGYFLVRDPACRHTRIPEQVLHEARIAFGTDEDILICSMPLK